nr:cell division control protein 2 like [Quercus suber]
MDLKPETILIDVTGVLKLGDFGTARVYTLQYRAPEILLGSEDYTVAIDIWSIGRIFFDMLVAKNQQKRKLFDGKSEIDMLQEIFCKLGTPDEQTWPRVSSLPGFAFGFPKFPPQDITTLVAELDPAGLDLLSKMLCINPSQRITAKDALNHEYLKDDVTPGC